MNIFVGTSSQTKIAAKYFKIVEDLTSSLARIPNLNLVFGADKDGLMGVVYENFKKNKKEITGVTIPKYQEQFKDLECNKEIVAPTTMERFKEIYEHSDILLYLPGGIGTYTELLNALEEKRTTNDKKLIIIYNEDFFFTPFITEMYDLYQTKFNPENLSNYCLIESSKDKVIETIKEALK
jgi:predicted Rossmann-fold nucleotide-binding protein